MCIFIWPKDCCFLVNVKHKTQAQQEQQFNANFKHYFWTEEQNSADQNKPSFLFVLMERGEIDLETIVKNLKDSKSFTPSKGQ